jgi:hypothetical protein
MLDRALGIYLNDHLAGSEAALQLLDKLEAAEARTPSKEFVVGLRREILADRDELVTLMKGLAIDESRLRRASGWVGSKLVSVKLDLDDAAGKGLWIFEALEALSLGIEGKRGLWTAMLAASGEAPALRLLDYEKLVSRAARQRASVEELRLKAALTAFRGAMEPARGARPAGPSETVSHRG